MLFPGPNRFTIVVTAEDTKTTTVYNLVIRRKIPKRPELSSGSVKLKHLECWAGLIPAFQPNRYMYASNEVAYGVESTVVKAIPVDEDAYIAVNDNAIKPGMLSDPIPLNPGENQIKVVVTGADGMTTGEPNRIF